MASKNVMEFTTDNWEQEVVRSDKPVVVDFWAPWCGPCRALAPTIDRVADQFAGRVKVGKVNVDDNNALAIQFGVNSIPRVLVFKGGNEPAHQFAFPPSEADLTKAINGLLGA